MTIDSLLTNELAELLPYLKPHEIAEMDRLLASASIEADNFTAYKQHINNRYIRAAHLDLLDRELEQVAQFVESGGQSGTWMLIVTMPPRHGKTLTAARLFPTWFLGRNPDRRVMIVSYGATLAHKSSRYARGIMQSPKYAQLFGLTLDPGSRAVDAWDLDEHEGGADALGVLGGATGKGADLLIMDDLIKNRSEAESGVIRDRTWDAVNDDLLTRLEPGGAVVLFATPWHQDDPIGRMIKLVSDPAKCNGPVKQLSLVALTETSEDVQRDPIGRGLNEALWGERYPVKVLQAIRERIGPYAWAGLYQQRPTPAEGGLFKRSGFKSIALIPVPQLEVVVRYWDLAMSDKTSADYTVGVKMGRDYGGHIYVMDVKRAQLDWGDVTDYMASVIMEDGPSVSQGIEEAGYMSRAVQDLAADPRLSNYAIWGYPAEKNKFTNALPFAARCAAGNVSVLESHWTTAYIEELCAFDKGAHDDQVDASSGAYRMLGAASIGDSEIVEDENTWFSGAY